MQVLVCPECTKALEERFTKKDFDDPTQFQLYYFPQHSRSIIRRCPLHPDITTHFPGEFEWDYESGDGGNPGEMAIPRNLLDVYPRQVRLQADKIFTIVICPQCLKELSEKPYFELVSAKYEMLAKELNHREQVNGCMN